VPRSASVTSVSGLSTSQAANLQLSTDARILHKNPPMPTDRLRTARSRFRARDYLLATFGYVALSILVLWNVWSGNPSTTTTCGCGDTSLFTWFLAWPAYALTHATNPLFSTAMFHPTGVNLLANTGEVAIGVVLSPITFWFGPIVSLNLALTLSPVLSALSMFVLLRRWVSWTPAAFVGGLAYGFSPFILIGLTDGHLMVSMAAVPPLIVACLDEILVRQGRRPLLVGSLLGLPVAIQFFVGTELLVITVIALTFGFSLVVVFALWNRATSMRNLRYAGVALATSLVTASVLLSYPLWFALAGPAHLSGPVWGTGAPISYVGTVFKHFLEPAAAIPIADTLTHRYGGYQAPVLSDQYIGFGMVAALVAGLVVWRRDSRLVLFAVVGAASIALSLGLQPHHWTPWRLFVRAPLMENLIPSRFLMVTYLCAAVMLGLIVDHCRLMTISGKFKPPVPVAADTCIEAASPRPLRRRIGAFIGTAIAMVALVPWATYLSAGMPLTVQAVVLPTWFAKVAPTLRGRHVVLAFPVPFASMQSAMTWQAVDKMSFSMAGGGGPSGLITRAGSEAAGQTVLGDLSTADSSPSATVVSAVEVGAVRKALKGWRVTTVVLPDTTGLQSYVQMYQIRSIVVLITAATGRPPIRQADAWIWAKVSESTPVANPSNAALANCGSGPSTGTITSINRAARCVVANLAPTPSNP